MALTDYLFRMTTAHLRSEALSHVERIAFFYRWNAAGGSFRTASPKWFAVWGRDKARMLRLKAVLLPASWIGLSDEEMLAVLLFQLRQIDPDIPDTPWLSADLAQAKVHLWHEASRGD
jgi:hypothetical protein